MEIALTHTLEMHIIIATAALLSYAVAIAIIMYFGKKIN